MSLIEVPVSAGELLDKITILELKLVFIRDEGKRANVQVELDLLRERARRHLPDDPTLDEMVAKLRDVNRALWSIEDDIRECERVRDFGRRFVELARAVYLNNDKRAALKKGINLHLGSTLIEEKSYAAY